MKQFKHFSVQRVLWNAWLIASVLSLFGVTVAMAAAGDLDTSFNSGGKLTMDFTAGQSGKARAVDVGSDGKIALAGDTQISSTNYNFAIARLTNKGDLDTTFNSNGKKSIDFGGYDQATALFIAPATNKIVVAGNKCSSNGLTCDVATVRLNTNGTLDTRWNDTGRRVDNFGSGDNRATAIAVQSDGYVVVAGYMYNGSNYDFAVMRYTPRGELDTNFNGSGKKSVGFGSGMNDQAFAVTIQGDGKIVVAGKSCDGSFLNCNFAIARLKTGGGLDTTFSADGKRTINYGAEESATGVAMQSNGKIVLVGSKEASGSSYFALARLNSGGGLDSTFAGTGKRTLDFSGAGDSLASAVVINSSSGKIIVCGSAAGNFALARFTSNGYLDTNFSGDGKVNVNFGGTDFCNALVIQPTDGRYMLAGWTNDGSLDHWAMTRILP